MKNLGLLIGLFFLIIACSSTKFIDSWRNKEVQEFKPNKLLIIGMTDNLTARKYFEEELSEAFIKRGINAQQSINVFNGTFTNGKKSELEIDEMIANLSKEGFDAVIITAIKGVEEKENVLDNYRYVNYRWAKLGRYYYKFQDIYYTPNYYETYKVYHIETSVYNINSDEDKSLVWVGALDIVNPQKIASTIKGYNRKIISQFEKENLIPTP